MPSKIPSWYICTPSGDDDLELKIHRLYPSLLFATKARCIPPPSCHYRPTIAVKGARMHGLHISLHVFWPSPDPLPRSIETMRHCCILTLIATAAPAVLPVLATLMCLSHNFQALAQTDSGHRSTIPTRRPPCQGHKRSTSQTAIRCVSNPLCPRGHSQVTRTMLLLSRAPCQDHIGM